MKVLLVGATGFTGKAVLRELLAKDHQVTALVRSKKRIDTIHPNLRVVEGDVTNQKLVSQAMVDQDAVVNCFGKNKGSEPDLISSMTSRIIRSMKENHVLRLVALSNVGAGDSFKNQPWLFRVVLLPTILKWLQLLIEDKNKMESMIRQSGLNWTILRFPKIENRKSRNRIRISADGKGLSFGISLEDCANFIVAQLEDKSLWYKSPSISN